MNKKLIVSEFQKIQSEICESLATFDGKSNFTVEEWTRPEGGGGITRVIKDGNILEKGGVNFSGVEGVLSDKIVKAIGVNDNNFFATGVSIVLHPENPFHPIIHMNIRYFELSDGTYWFGGGLDLTPIYIKPEESKAFHTALKKVCNRFDSNAYNKYKEWADNYFYIPHREETRGIGGIFFDRLSEKSTEKTKEEIFNFVCQVGRTFAPTYIELIQPKKDISYNDDHKKWQLIRRSRYVEFNLVHDKGTKFGLETNGRIESILMSMPPQANWEYCHTPQKGSEEEFTLSQLKKGIQWI